MWQLKRVGNLFYKSKKKFYKVGNGPKKSNIPADKDGHTGLIRFQVHLVNAFTYWPISQLT